MDADGAALRETWELVAEAAIRLLVREPFWGHLLAGMARVVDPEARAMSLALDRADVPHLRVAPSYWKALTRPAQPGALKRQLLHLVFEHPMRVTEFPHRTLYDLAAELVVNQYLSSTERRPDALTIDRLHLPAGLGVAAYYALLLELANHSSAGGTGTRRTGEGSGTDEGTLGDADAVLRGSAHPSFAEHDGWETFARSDAATREVVAICVRTLVRHAAERSLWNDLPAAVRRAVARHLETGDPLDWRRLLRMFSSTTRRTRIRNTVRRPSKRYGTTPGIRVQRYGHRLIVGLDTSQSITAEQLGSFFAELEHLRRSGAAIRIVECDADIAAIRDYRGGTPADVRGGGGTAFDPVLAYANQQRPDGVIYFTDGFAPAPRIASRVPVLWIIAPGGVTPDTWDHLPGRKVMMRGA